MTRPAEIDVDLPLFAAEGPVPEPGRVDPALAIAAPASDRPFRLEGERVAVAGIERGPITSIHIDGVRVVGRIEAAGAGAVANTLVSPGRIRRERIGAGESAQETVLIAPTLPWAALHWTAPTVVRLHALPDASNIRFHAGEGMVTVADPATDFVLALALITDRPTWTAEAVEGRGLRLSGGGGGGPATLLVAYGAPDAIRTAFRAARHMASHEARAVAAPRNETIRLTTGAPELDDAVAWMASRLRNGVLRTEARMDAGAEPRDPEAWMWAGLGSVAVGDADGTLRCIRALRRIDAPVAAGLLAGRLALTTGEAEAAQGSIDVLLASPIEGHDEALRMLARRTVADGLRYGAPEAVLGRLKEGMAAPSPSGPSGRRLPTIGNVAGDRGVGRSQGSGEWLAAMLEPTTSGSVPLPRKDPAEDADSHDRREEIGRALGAWRDFVREPTSGWASWRMLVHGGMGGARGAAAWDDLFGAPAVTGILLATMVHGWLGAFPDAPVGRLVLKPRLPRNLETFTAQDIPVGDARITMKYEHRSGVRTFAFDIGRGRVPPYLVFEATVPDEVGRVLLDGASIDPDIAVRSDGTTVRLQTALDAPRTIEIEPA